MARRAASCLSSDDELPDLETLLRNPYSKATKNTASTAKSPAKGPIPKSSSKSSSRRVRRLAGSNETSCDNPLLGRWTSDSQQASLGNLELRSREFGTTGKTPKNKEPSISTVQEQEPTDEDESTHESTQPTQRSFSIRRTEASVTAGDDSDDASESDTEALLTRIRRLRAARTTTRSTTTESGRQQPNSPQLKDGVQGRQQLATTGKKEANNDETIPEDPKAYQTAEEDYYSYSEGSSSEFELGDSPGWPKEKVRQKAPLIHSKQPAGASRAKLLVKNAPPLKPRGLSRQTRRAMGDEEGLDNAETSRTTTRVTRKESGKTRGASGVKTKTTTSELADTFCKLRLQLGEFSDDEVETKPGRYATPPSTPPRTTKPKGLVSPSKRIVIPQTPHRPSVDAFWNPDIVNEWNDMHSPRKLLLPAVTKSPAKASPAKERKESKKSFSSRKHALAEDFMRELDEKITDGKIAQLAESTGGVKVVWSKTLNKTAGRAHWKKETLRTKGPSGSQVSVTYKHHASIELAEKVVDDEHRLLNTLAHEFCHLANFMISGIKTNPHGKEFKAWGAKCSRVFADRGIEVTTKHTYDIDFKYIWTCCDCAIEYKRHSKSIDPSRHRCGGCKGLLKQTKPTPRGGGAAGGGGKPSKYQAFVKEQMKIVREENPGSPQKDVMRLVAHKWAKQGGGGSQNATDEVVTQVVDLTLEDKNL